MDADLAELGNTLLFSLFLVLLLANVDRGELADSLRGVDAVPITLPDGEAYKNWDTLNQIFDALLNNRCERGTTLIALGGGGYNLENISQAWPVVVRAML